MAIPETSLALACVLATPDRGRAARLWGRRVLVEGPEAAPPDIDIDRVLEHQVGRTQQELARTGWRFLPIGDPAFPIRLAAIADPPLGVFVRGATPGGPVAAIVGARSASSYGREVAELFARELASAGVTVVSGMARGVDAAAHRGALAAGGPTAAVWGAGPDRVYPAEHASLAEEIAAHGCLITEYPPGSPPRASHFPERNRLIAGLADVVVVVEANERSGALITANLALDEGRDVMAVPGSIFSRLSVGPNGLLRSGAAPALITEDILTVLGVVAPPPVKPAAEDPLLSAIPHGEAVTVDHIAAVAGLPVAQVLDSLLRLELGGAISRERDGRYRRSHAHSGSVFE
jgi:DNA processing protein